MAELQEILTFCVQVLFTAGVLWAALKITKTQGDFSGMLLIAFICGLLGLHPEPWGMLASLLVMFLLIAKFTSAKFSPRRSSLSCSPGFSDFCPDLFLSLPRGFL